MSDLLATPPDDEEESSRSRAVWGLAALAIIAGLIVALLFATSGSGGHHQDRGLSQVPSAPLTLAPTPTTPSPTLSSTTSSTTSSTASWAIPTSTANPCRVAAQCAVPDDAGQLVAAVNRFRTSHGRPAVTGAVSPQAQQCALSQGEGPACAPSYAWEPVPTQDGPKAVGLVVGRGDGTQWLLDPAMRSFSVGWAYAGGQYECAILKAG